jgi:hypothetical protein
LKSIYGFKQAPRDWRRCADALLKSMGFKSSSIDASLYYLFESETGLIFILCLFVDDFLSACNSEKRYKQFVADFNAKYECVNLGELRQYVGMEFKRDDVKYGEGTLAISRKHAVLQVIEKFDLKDAKPRKYPLTAGNLTLERIDPPVADGGRFSSLLGALQYERRTWRFDLAFPIAYFGMFATHHGHEHFEMLKHTLLYLKGTLDVPLLLRKKQGFTVGDAFQLSMYADASFADKDMPQWQSTSGWQVFLNDSPVCAGSQREKYTALSSTEAELVAFHRGCRDPMAHYHLIISLSLEVVLPMVTYCDNTTTIALLNDTVHNSRTKHIAVQYFWARQLVEQGYIKVLYVRSERNRADLFTKAVNGSQHAFLRNLVLGHAEAAP